MRGLNSNPMPMLPDRGKIMCMMEKVVDEGFAAVAERDGVLVAYIGAIVTENPFYERFQASVVAWYSEEPRAGFKLFEMMMEWKERYPMIGSITIATNPDKRLEKILVKRGWITLPSYLLVG